MSNTRDQNADKPEDPKDADKPEDDDYIHQPHDGIVKAAMSERQVALEMFEKYVPDDIKPLIDPEKYTAVNRTFVDTDLRQLVSDVVFCFPRKDKKKGRVYAYT